MKRSQNASAGLGARIHRTRYGVDLRAYGAALAKSIFPQLVKPRRPFRIRIRPTVIVIRGAQGSGKTTTARALALAATARGEAAVVFEGDDDLRGLATVAKRVDLVVICHQYEATMPKLPRGLRTAFVLTCKAGA